MVADGLQRPEDSPLTAAEWRRLSEPSRRWVRELLAEVVELRARVGMNSSNSSRPPSSDPPHIKKPSRAPSGRCPGGQLGHPGHVRPLVPAEKVDAVEEFHPERCRRCGADLPRQGGGDPEPLCHQVAEIPAIEPHVTEYRRHRVCCRRCGTVSLAALPMGVPEGSFGPNLRALLVVLSGRFRVSRREVVEFCGEALGLSISVGCVDNICRSVGEALLRPVQEVERHIQTAEVVHPDESGWSQKGVRHWIWVAVTAVAACFRIDKSRGAKVVREVLGETFQGCIVSDRWSAYSVIPAKRRQVCWAHLKRDFQRLVDRGGAARAFGDRGLRLVQELFSIWQGYQREEMSRRRMKERMAEVETSVGDLLGEGIWSPDRKVNGFCGKLLDLEPALFLFSRLPGVEPTNNKAERALRPVVLWRKGSFGTNSEAGSRFVERMMTVVMTCRIQGRSVLSYLREVCAAQDRGGRIPSLLARKARDRPEIGEARQPHRLRRRAG
jgi:transposase